MNSKARDEKALQTREFALKEHSRQGDNGDFGMSCEETQQNTDIISASDDARLVDAIGTKFTQNGPRKKEVTLAKPLYKGNARDFRMSKNRNNEYRGSMNTKGDRRVKESSGAKTAENASHVKKFILGKPPLGGNHESRIIHEKCARNISGVSIDA